ncbi:hypothetical protein V7S43_012387 [Phytophthora oleae]|uniref:Uncharacterized protein n=1 Tax=Phytophthora oleae TaxID=2107226 RepID=A0ABD3F7W0_9STRA
MMNPLYTPPLAAELSTYLLSDTYQATMTVMQTALQKPSALTVRIDGATNVLSRSLSNVMVHDHRSWFAEYLTASLKKESAIEVSRKVASSILRLNEFTNPPGTLPQDLHKRVFAFISDSCNLMRAVRSMLFDGDVVQLTYGLGHMHLTTSVKTSLRYQPQKMGFAEPFTSPK